MTNGSGHRLAQIGHRYGLWYRPQVNTGAKAIEKAALDSYGRGAYHRGARTGSRTAKGGAAWQRTTR